ncbi:MAG: sigma-70 family RNA polymerase sigma factor [Muribaculaceae bacterium]|nr:sigma-70 family RNA polymerase sigma factor [Muribaculaceae bacterium]
MATVKDIEQIFRSNYRAMFVLANRMLHDEEAARDIVHDVFASLLDSDSRQATTAYLLRGVRFACANYMRSLSTRERISLLYATDLRDVEEEAWPDEEAIANLNQTVDRCLTEQTRKIVKLRFFSLLTYREIADELNVSEVTVYKHLHHAINVLRQHFKENEG